LLLLLRLALLRQLCHLLLVSLKLLPVRLLHLNHLLVHLLLLLLQSLGGLEQLLALLLSFLNLSLELRDRLVRNRRFGL